MLGTLGVVDIELRELLPPVNQSELSIQVTWSGLDQSEASVTCLTPALTVRMRSVSHGGLGAGAQLWVLLDAGQLGGRLEEVVHRVFALQGRDLGEVRVLKIVIEDYNNLSSGHKSEFLISKFNTRQIKDKTRK